MNTGHGMSDFADVVDWHVGSVVRWWADRARKYPRAIAAVENRHGIRLAQVHIGVRVTSVSVLASGQLLTTEPTERVHRRVASGKRTMSAEEIDQRRWRALMGGRDDADVYTMVDRFHLAELDEWVRVHADVDRPDLSVLAWMEQMAVDDSRLPWARLGARFGLSDGEAEAAHRMALWECGRRRTFAETGQGADV